MKFLDEITKIATFTSASELMRGINALSDHKVDEKSCYLTLCGIRFKDVDGNKFAYTNDKSIFVGLRDDFNIDLNVHKCRRIRRVFKLALNSIPEVKDIEVNIPQHEQEDLKEAIITTLEIPTETEVVEDITIDYLKSLYDENDKKGSKDKLDEIVTQRWNITLNKRLTFENMIVELESELENIESTK